MHTNPMVITFGFFRHLHQMLPRTQFKQWKSSYQTNLSLSCGFLDNFFLLSFFFKLTWFFFSSLLFSIYPSLSFSMVSSVASFLTNLQSHNHFVLQGHAMELVKKNRGGGLFWPAPLREEMSWFLSYCIYTSPLITLGLSNIFRLTSRIIFIIHNYSFNVS